VLACDREFGLPDLGRIEPEARVERFEHHHLPADGLLRRWKRLQKLTFRTP
jgi:hypothetical protein